MRWAMRRLVRPCRTCSATFHSAGVSTSSCRGRPGPTVMEGRLAPGTANYPTRSSSGADEAVEDLLAAGVLEVDLELVAFDRSDRAVAEFSMENALAQRQIGS